MSDEASTLKKDVKEDRKKVLQRAFFMASGTLTSRILGLFRDMALAALFDRAVTDAWAAAFRLPNLFRRLFGEGSLSVSFIPVFLEAKDGDPHGPRVQNLVNALYTILLIALAVVAVLGVIYMDSVLGLLLSSRYMADTEKWFLTVRMARIMFGFVFFVCTYAYFMGILNALGVFGLPAVAPALLNISMLAFTFMPTSWFAEKGDGLAWGVLVGGVLQASLLWIALKARGFLPRLQKNIWNHDVKKVLINMVPGLLGIGLLQFSTLVNLHFASTIGEGAISYVYWADRLLELPLSLVSVSLGAALLPTLSEFAFRKQKEQFQETVEEHFLFSFFLAWPAALGLYFLAQPIVEVLFMRGHFSMDDVNATTIVLKVYALSLLFVSSIRILAPAFYAVKNTWLPAGTSLVSLLLHLSWAGWWIRQAGLQGLVLSSLLAMILQFIAMLIALHVTVMTVRWRKVSIEILKTVIAGTLLAAAVQIYEPLSALIGSSGFARMIALGISILLGGGVYLISSHLLKISQGQFLISTIRRKIKIP